MQWFGDDLVCVDDDIDEYYCWICESEKKGLDLPILKGSTSALNHMMSHGYDRGGNKIENGFGYIPGAAALYTLVAAKRYESFKALLVHWIVYRHVAFAMLESEVFRKLLGSVFEPPVAMCTRSAAEIDNGRMHQSKGCLERRVDSGSQQHPSIFRSLDGTKLQWPS